MSDRNENWHLFFFGKDTDLVDHIQQRLIKELVEDGYGFEEIKTILRVLSQNASQWLTDSPQKANYMNAELQALINRSRAMRPNQYDTLTLELGFTDAEIHQMFFANQVSLDQLIQNTKQTLRQAELLGENSYTNAEIHQMLITGFTIQNMQTTIDRVMKTKRYDKDQYGLTTEQIHDLLFGGRDIYGQPTSGIVTSLLSGNNAKIREGTVARCVLDWVTMFDQRIGRRGSTTQIDVGTQRYIIEAKIDSVSGGYLSQVQKLLRANPGKDLLLYAPGYQQSAAQTIASMTGERARVVRSCADLRKTITAQGGP